MRRIIPFLLAILLAACATQTAGPLAAPSQSPTPEVASTPMGLSTQVPATSSAPTAIPTAALTLTPAAVPITPVSRVIGPDNYRQASPIQVYRQTFGDAIQKQFGVGPGESRIDMWTYSPDGKYIAIGGCTSLSTAMCYSSDESANSFLYILDAGTAELIASIPENDVEVHGLAFSPDGKWLVYAVCPQRLVLWNMATQQKEMTLWQGSKCASYPNSVFSPDGSQVALTVDTRLIIFDVATGRQITQQTAQQYGSVLPKYSQDGTRLAVFAAKYGHAIAIYDTASWQKVSLINVSDKDVGSQSVDFSQDGKWVVTVVAGEDTDPVLWDATTGKQVAVLDEPLNWLGGLAFSPDGRLLLVGGTPGNLTDLDRIAVWDMATRQRLGALEGGSIGDPQHIIFAADGESFVMSGLGLVLAGFERWALPDTKLIAARQAVTDMLTALASGDYQTAAGWFQPDEDARASLQSLGLDPDDLPAALQAICARDPSPCMPIQTISFNGMWDQGIYFIELQFATSDGSPYLGLNGETNFSAAATVLPDGRGRVINLPNFFYSTGQ